MSDKESLSSSNPYIEFAERYRDDWPGLVREVFGVEPDPWQAEELTAVQRGERRISIRSGHGVGKSAFAAWVCWCALLTGPASTMVPTGDEGAVPAVKIVITAPSGPQLWDALFAEIRMWGNRLPEALRECYEFKTDRIEHKAAPESIFISARTSRAENPEALQGVHADSGRVILIADEASGVPEAVFEAAAGSMSGHNCTTILLGNPTRSQGFFFDTHTRLAAMWRTRRVNCMDSRRVAQDFIDDMRARYGEDSNAFRVRVLGEFPRSDDSTLISIELVEAAMTRDITLDPVWVGVWGLDVARFGDDETALVKRYGKIITDKPQVWSKLDTMQIVGRVKHEYDSTPINQRPVEINVDVIGIGAGVVDRGRELGLPMRGINVSEAPSFSDGYMKLRDELWDKGKQWLAARDCKIPNDPRFLELTLPKYEFSSNGKMKVEGKDDLKKRTRAKSPNVADAFNLTMASDAITASSSGYASSWSKPLRRNIKGVV